MSDVLSRITAALEAFDEGDSDYGTDLLRDLQRELVERTHKRHRCVHCGNRYRWPGELEAHVLEAHGWRRVA